VAYVNWTAINNLTLTYAYQQDGHSHWPCMQLPGEDYKAFLLLGANISHLT